MKNKNFNFLLIILTSFLIIFLTIGYSVFSSNLNISGDAVYRVEKDVRITNLSLNSTSYDGLSSYSKFGHDNINVGNTLKNINSTVTYNVEITNKGNVPVILKSITPNYGANENIEYVVNNIKVGSFVIDPDALKQGDETGKPTIITVTIKYKDTVTSIPNNIDANMILKFEFIKVESILAKGNTESNMLFNKDLSEIDSSLTKANVRTIVLKPMSEISSEEGSTSSTIWDASLNKDGTVIAYFRKTNSSANYYQLTLYGYGQIKLPEDSSNLFYGCTVLTQITQNINLNSEDVTKMNYMFYNCGSLYAINVTNFNTTKVTDMSYMFYGCKSLFSNTSTTSSRTLNLEAFDFSNVVDTSYMFYNCATLKGISFNSKKNASATITNMSYMFYGCKAITDLDLSLFNTLNVADMNHMFYNCDALTSLNIKDFNTSNVLDMSYMFYHCEALTNLDLSNFNTLKVTNMREMFMYCKAITSLDLSSFNTSNVNDMREMFYECNSMKSLILGENFDASKTASFIKMFYNCSSLISLDLSNFLVKEETNVTDLSYMFQNCSSLKSINFGDNFFAKNVSDMTFMFQNCTSLESLNLNIVTSEKLTKISNMFEGCSGLTYVSFGSGFNTSKVTNLSRLFYNCTNLGKNEVININLNVSSSNSISHMFYNCINLIGVTFGSEFNTSKVTDFSSMFYGCSKLKSLNLSLEFSSASKMNYMFKDCTELVNIKLKNNKNYSNTIDSSNMFYRCISLKTIDLSEFSVSIGSLNSMFYGCSSLLTVDFGEMSLNSTTNFTSMFENCTSLQTIDLSSKTVSNANVFEKMFYNCSNLTSVNLSGASNNQVTNTKNMFNGCSKLTSIDISKMSFKYSIISSSRADIDGMFTSVPAGATIKVSSSSNDKGTTRKSGYTYLKDSGNFNFVQV